MTKLTKILCCILAPLGMFFCMVGYASLSSTLTMHGSAQLEMPDAVYIAEIKDIDYTNASRVGTTGDPTNINFPSTKFVSNINFSAGGGSVTFTVRIVNGTEATPIFNILTHLDVEGYDDADVTATIKDTAGNEILQGLEIEPNGGYVDCKVTLTCSKEGTRKTMYDIAFVWNSDDLTEMASEAVVEQFGKILNNQLEAFTYTYSSIFGTRTVTVEAGGSFDAMKDEFAYWGLGDYIANTDGAPADDASFLNAAFGDTLTLEIDGEKHPVSVLIKAQNLYGSSETEMTLYMTADPLNTPRDQNPYPPVFAAVFTKNATTGQWEQVGKIYEGKAKQVSYYILGDGTGSFNTDTWVSTEEYYGADSGSNLAAILAAYEDQQQ